MKKPIPEFIRNHFLHEFRRSRQQIRALRQQVEQDAKRGAMKPCESTRLIAYWTKVYFIPN